MAGPMTAGSLHSQTTTFQYHVDEANKSGELDSTMIEYVQLVRTDIQVVFVKEVSMKENLNEEDSTTARSTAMLVDGTRHGGQNCMLGAYMSAVDKGQSKNATKMYQDCPKGSMEPVAMRNVVVVVLLEDDSAPFDPISNRFTRVRVAATKRMIVKPCPSLYNASWFKAWVNLTPTKVYPIPSPPMEEENSDASLPHLVVRIKGIERHDKDNVELHVIIKDTNKEVIMSIHDTRRMFQTKDFEKSIGKLAFVGCNKGIVVKSEHDYMIPTTCGIMWPEVYERLSKMTLSSENKDATKMKTFDDKESEVAEPMPVDESEKVFNARAALVVAEAQLRSMIEKKPRPKVDELKLFTEEKKRCEIALKKAQDDDAFEVLPPVVRAHPVQSS